MCRAKRSQAALVRRGAARVRPCGAGWLACWAVYALLVLPIIGWFVLPLLSSAPAHETRAVGDLPVACPSPACFI